MSGPPAEDKLLLSLIKAAASQGQYNEVVWLASHLTQGTRDHLITVSADLLIALQVADDAAKGIERGKE